MRPQDAILQTLAESRAAGAFDPLTLMVSFPLPRGQNRPKTANEIWDLARTLPTSIIAHELCHSLQTSSTPFGVRRFGLYIESLHNNLMLLGAVRRSSSAARLKLPLQKTISKLAAVDENIAQLEGLRSTAWVNAVLLDGGVEIKREVLKKSEALIPDFLYLHAALRSQWPTYVVDLKKAIGIDRVVLLGGRHIMEGAAMAIQLIQARIHDEPALLRACDPGSVMLPGDVPTELYDPYFLTQMVYTALTGTDGSLEEFYALSDLSLMCDTAIGDWDDLVADPSPDLERRISDKRTNNSDLPIHWFINAVGSFATTPSHAIRDAGFNWTSSDVVRTQDDVLAMVGMRSMADISRRLLAYVDYVFNLYRTEMCFPERVLALVQEYFVRSIRFRLHALDGGAHLNDLLAGNEHLIHILRGQGPGVAVGLDFASVDVSPGSGLGVWLIWLRLIDDYMEALIRGDRSCPFHATSILGGGRCCAASPVPLCQGYRFHRKQDMRESALHCSREEAILFVDKVTGISKVKWN